MSLLPHLCASAFSCEGDNNALKCSPLLFISSNHISYKFQVEHYSLLKRMGEHYAYYQKYTKTWNLLMIQITNLPKISPIQAPILKIGRFKKNCPFLKNFHKVLLCKMVNICLTGLICWKKKMKPILCSQNCFLSLKES